jgi:GNAT superfamily N-acetyltransferase
MEAKFYENVEEFYEISFPYLLKHEAENNLLLTILISLNQNKEQYEEEAPLLFSLKDNKNIKIIALRTPPHDLIIAYSDTFEAIDILVDELYNRKIKLPGVLSFKEAADTFAKLWSEKNSIRCNLLRKERVFKLIEVSEEYIGDNDFSVASKIHQTLVLKWAREMIKEALVDATEGYVEHTIKNITKEFEENNYRFYLLFNNSVPVSMVRKAGKTPNGNFVNFVYTPPSLRRKGYATECVAKMSKLLLEEGNKYCFLFTDLSNPTSNSIYQKIGYRPVIDENHYKFLEN